MMECGVDIAKIERFEKLVKTDTFFDKYFTFEEVEYIKNKQNMAQTVAGMFAAKEAFLKALGIGIGMGVDLKDINILHQNGMPKIEITPKIDYFLQKVGCQDVSVSISHDGDYAIAFCVVM